MRKILIAVLLATGLLVVTGIRTEKEASLPEICVRFVENNAEPLSLPGVETQVNIAVKNKGKTDVFIFVRVSVPVVMEDDVWVGEDFSDWIPVVSYEVEDTWNLLEERVENGQLEQIYYYKDSLRSGETSDPLITSWHITNFIVQNDKCGAYTWEELCELLDKIEISVHGLQADVFRLSSPEQMWQLTK